MRALLPRQQWFVLAFWERGTGNATEAARAARYTDGEHTKKQAYLLVHNPKVQAALQEVGRTMFLSKAPLALGELWKIAENREHSDQLRAILAVLNRSGFGEQREINVNVKHELTHIEKWRKLLDIKRNAGIDVTPMLENMTPDERAKVLEGVEYEVK